MTRKFYFDHEKLFINKELILLSNNRFREIYEDGIYQTDISHIRELRSASISKEPIFKEILDKIHKKFQLKIDASDLKFDKLWLLNSSPKNINLNTLPYIPHIDYQRYLKAMVYLHDVSLKHGPIYLGKVKNNVDIDQKRRELPKDYKIKTLNRIYDEQIDGNLVPIIGKAGDVIFFDTNTPHKASKIDQGYCRKVLRFDFERPSFNPKKSINNQIKNFIKKKFF